MTDTPRPPPSSLSDMAAACAANRDLADRQMARVQGGLSGVLPGPERDALLCDLSRYHAEYEHWAGYVAYYKGRAAREGAAAVTKPSWPPTWKPPSAAREPAPAPPDPAPDPRLPREREPGDDDDEE